MPADENSQFDDHFSDLSAGYARYRPHYPPGLFQWLAEQSPGLDLAWDHACGTGQATRGLARHFKKVIGSDASRAQIDAAEGPLNVFYQVADAQTVFLPDGEVDLLCVAQAAHWLDLPSFYNVARQKLKPRGLIALWTYGLFTCEGDTMPIIDHYYKNVVGKYWPPQRQWVDAGYKGMKFPFENIVPPKITMTREWSLEQLWGYLGTWSAGKAYKQATGQEPRQVIEKSLLDAFPDGGKLNVSWELKMKVGRNRQG